LKKIVNREDIKELIRIDQTFAFINSKYGPPPNWSRPQGFLSLSKIILEQQISLAAANAHFLKLSGYMSGFTPSNILKLTDEEMRICQISRQKSKYLRELSATILEGVIDLHGLSKLNETEVKKQLTRIKGIGDWTTDIYLMFCLQAKNTFPIGDIAVIKAVKELYHVKTMKEVALLSENWRPFRSLATYYFWHYYLCKRSKTPES